MDSYRVGDIAVNVVNRAQPGARPPVLLVHGAGHGAWCWDGWMRQLAREGWEAHALSLRNHPPSGAVDAETFCTRLSVSDYVADVASVAAGIGRPAVVVGHSMGGIVVQSFAATNHEAAIAPAGMVLMTAAPPGQLGPIRDAPLPTSAPVTLDPATIAQRYFAGAPAAVVAQAVMKIVGESPSVMNEYSLGEGVPIARDAIRCPMLVLSAGLDGSTVPKDSRIADYYDADYIHKGETGHDMMLEPGADVLLNEVLAWVEASVMAPGSSH